MIYMASRLLNPITGGVKNISNVSSWRFRDESENLCKESKILGHPKPRIFEDPFKKNSEKCDFLSFWGP